MIYIYYHPLHDVTDSAVLTIRGLRQYLKETDPCQSSHSSGDLMHVHIVRDTAQGKPYFKEHPQVCHNVSHSGDWWVCAYGPVEMGLDLQKVEKKGIERVNKIARRFFHKDEINWLMNRPEEEFYRLWAYNESYVKYTGAGLTKGLDAFSTVSCSKGCREPVLGQEEVCQQEISFVEEGYYMVLSSKDSEEFCLRILA